MVRRETIFLLMIEPYRGRRDSLVAIMSLCGKSERRLRIIGEPQMRAALKSDTIRPGGDAILTRELLARLPTLSVHNLT